MQCKHSKLSPSAFLQPMTSRVRLDDALFGSPHSTSIDWLSFREEVAGVRVQWDLYFLEFTRTALEYSMSLREFSTRRIPP